MQTNSCFPNIWVQLGLNWHIMQIAIPSKDFAPLVHKICTIRTEFKGGRDYIVVEWLLDNRTTKQAWSYAFCTAAGRQTTNSYTVHEADNQYDNKETDSDNKIHQIKEIRDIEQTKEIFWCQN